MHILAGEFKGRVLLSPQSGSSTRPITAAAKKSLFDILSPVLGEAAVVDLYCGTGTMGLEALSRGAAWCAFADRDRGVLRLLHRNIEALRVGDRCIVWNGDVSTHLREWLAQLPQRMDVAFVDPPYAQARQWSWAQVEGTIFVPLAERLAAHGRVVLRVPAGLAVPDHLGTLAVQRTKRYGDMVVLLWGVPGEGQGGPAA